MEDNHKKKEEAGSLEEVFKSLEGQDWLLYFPLYVNPKVKKILGARLLQQPFKTHAAYETWLQYCFQEEETNIVKLAGAVAASSKTVVLTGAGMSTESNLPDFRSKAGWWQKIDPKSIAVPEAVENNYSVFADFYGERIKALESTAPHAGHFILAEWEKSSLIHSVATQNVDGLHRKAGSRNVYELHGALDKVKCHRCGTETEIDNFLQKKPCASCSGRLRPGVVLFGEFLPEDAWNGALKNIEEADLVIVIGTSLEVYPVNQLPRMTDGRTIYVNAETESEHGSFDLLVKGKAKEVLEKVEVVLRNMSFY
ncbi:MAG: NAD-dependent deacylase [Alkalicoccus sp.]|nr:MAG: NAD-dependent deacylase [Alkalicoccus sp.]